MKKVFVALANKKFIEHTKSLFYSAKVDGKWDGDFVLIVPEEDRGTFDEKLFEDNDTLSVTIFYGKKLPGYPSAHYYKYYLWTKFFKKWDWIFYCDTDVLFFNKIEFDLKNKKKDILYTNDCAELPLSYQFEYRNEKVEKFTKEQDEKYIWINQNYGSWDKGPNLPSFQSCFMLYHKNLIHDDTFDNLLKLHYEYYIYYDLILHGLTEEQSILNVEFIGRWEHLGDKFLNVYQRAETLEWEFDKMGEPFEDKRNYKKEGIIAQHFYQFFQPWSKHNLRFYPQWKEYHDNF